MTNQPLAESHGAAIDELRLQDDLIPEINYAAPEPGQYPPRLKPGIYDFLFSLEDDPFGKTTWKKDGKDFFEVRHKATITHNGAHGTPEEVQLRYIRANSYLSEGMKEAQANHSLGNLIRSLGIELPHRALAQAEIEEALRQADGRAHGKLALGWRAVLPGTETVVATNAKNSKGETKWPKTGNEFDLTVMDPKSGTTVYGRENVTGYRFPPSPSPEASPSREVVVEDEFPAA